LIQGSTCGGCNQSPIAGRCCLNSRISKDRKRCLCATQG
jgi:hypothetical protein